MKKGVLAVIIVLFLIVDGVATYFYFFNHSFSLPSFTFPTSKKQTNPLPSVAPDKLPQNLRQEVYLTDGTVKNWNAQTQVLTLEQNGKESTISAKGAKLYYISWTKDNQPVATEGSWDNLQPEKDSLTALCQDKNCQAIVAAFVH